MLRSFLYKHKEKQAWMNLISVSQVTNEGNRYLGWPKLATAKVLYHQLTEGSLSPQPER